MARKFHRKISYAALHFGLLAIVRIVVLLDGLFFHPGSGALRPLDPPDSADAGNADGAASNDPAV